MQTIAIGMICMRNVHVEKRGLPSVTRSAEEIDSSSGKKTRPKQTECTTVETGLVLGTSLLTGRPAASGKLWTRVQNRLIPRIASS